MSENTYILYRDNDGNVHEFVGEQTGIKPVSEDGKMDIAITFKTAAGEHTVLDSQVLDVKGTQEPLSVVRRKPAYLG